RPQETPNRSRSWQSLKPLVTKTAHNDWALSVRRRAEPRPFKQSGLRLFLFRVQLAELAVVSSFVSACLYCQTFANPIRCYQLTTSTIWNHEEPRGFCGLQPEPKKLTFSVRPSPSFFSRGVSVGCGPRHGGTRSAGRNACCDGLAGGIGTGSVVGTSLDS